MDKRLEEQVAAWLEFYRELGIEDFYAGVPEAKRVVAADPTVSPDRLGQAHRPAPTVGPRSVSSLVGITKEPPVSPAPRPAGRPAAQSSEEPSERLGPHGLRAAGRTLSLFETPPVPRTRETLEQIQQDLGDCRRCKLAAGRKTIVFGQGNPEAELLFVGEAPGADEDEQGLPFVGRAGQLLNRMIQLIGMKRQEVYICNIIKCRPPGNRTPEPDEIDTCSPFVFRQIEAIRPRLICCLGAPAVRTVLGVRDPMTRIRGRFYDYGNTKAFVTFHPAYILRNAREEKLLREDFEKIRDFLTKHI